MSAGKKDITKELAYKDGKYSLTLTHSSPAMIIEQNKAKID